MNRLWTLQSLPSLVNEKLEEARDLFIKLMGWSVKQLCSSKSNWMLSLLGPFFLGSAASLAMNAGDFHNAEKMIAMGQQVNLLRRLRRSCGSSF